jgi:two-component system, NarL family, sensor kinase
MNNQYIIPLFVAGSLLLAIFGFFLIAYMVVQKRKQAKYQLERQRMIFDHQNNILRTRIEEQENTMDQISKELHDNIKSVLGYIQMSMYKIAESSSSIEEAKQIEKLNNTLGTVIDDLHNISHSLNSNFIKSIGLVETISKDLENIRMNKNITYNIEINGNHLTLTPEKELHIYRIAQEAIQNAIKHAKATHIGVVIFFDSGQFRLKITDNGVGFDKNKIYEMKGLGFINMFQRARYVNGLLDVQPAPMKGTSIALSLNSYNDGITNDGNS